jgi:hypothetical protein
LFIKVHKFLQRGLLHSGAKNKEEKTRGFTGYKKAWLVGQVHEEQKRQAGGLINWSMNFQTAGKWFMKPTC